jgi:hypothetical protein
MSMDSFGQPYYDAVKRRFLKDVEGHTITLAMADPLPSRYIVVRNPKESGYWWKIVTYPGGLLITGDMGTYCFERENDMFGWWPADYRGHPSYSYIAEKCVAADKGGTGVKRFNEAKAKHLIDELEREHREEYGPQAAEDEDDEPIEDRTNPDFLQMIVSIREWFDSDEFHESDTLFYQAIERANQRLWNERTGESTRDYDRFHIDLCEFGSPNDYSFHFLWCVHAVRWTIDRLAAQQTESEAREQSLLQLLNQTESETPS